MDSSRRKKIAMSGATGFVGTFLREKFTGRGWEVLPLGRQDFALSAAALAAKLKGVDAIVNLAGAPVINRWSAAYKEILRTSRIDVTRKLVEACGLLAQKPEAFLSTSAVGIYASSETRVHTEADNQLAQDFLGSLARDWEAEAAQAKGLGIRTAIFRFGIVLGPGGGALQQMLPVFRLGLGGTIGSGRQPVSWIHIQDLGRVYLQALEDPAFVGTYNLTAPEPTTNQGLTEALGRALGRPAFFRVPEFVLRLRFGEGAAILTRGQTAVPGRLLDQGFSFSYPNIDGAVRSCIA